MMLVVSGVGTLIHVYAAGYMHYDVRYKGAPRSYRRFFVYLNLFVAAMMLLVGAANYLMLVRRMGRRGPLLVPPDRVLV